MREIQLTQNQVALVDDDIYEELNRFKWFAKKDKNTFYAVRNTQAVNGKRHTIYMHREIMESMPKGLMPDHKNGTGTDNRRENLRFVTNRQNQQNQQNVTTSSKYPGVSWYKQNKRWNSQIKINGKRKHLGYFTNEKKAFEVYKKTINAIGETIVGEI